MSDTHDPEYSGQGYLPGPAFGGYSYATPPPPPPRPHRSRALVITGVAALAIGAAAGGLINGLGSSPAGTATATSKTMLTTGEIAARVDPGLVDVVSTDGLAQQESAGTGIVLTSNGEILTNNHVISGATSIKVTDIGNGKTYTAKVVGYDQSHDVAVIQAEGASGLTRASFGDSSSVKLGDRVVALGNAQGKGGTPSVAEGNVTALNQSITASDEASGDSEQLTGLIETDAPIQPGDSGGSLVNAYGQVIGVDTAASSTYQFQGQGNSGTTAYAIPINTALSIANQIEAGHGSSTVHIGATAYLGVGVNPQGASNGFGVPGSSTAAGAYLAEVAQNSPAANAGLVQGDTLTTVGGTSVSSFEDIQHALVKYHPGDSVSISWTDATGQSHSANVTLATGPAQ
ncbi:MAG TPA: trypsin-like peptidase domain-containing protein [Streptosporangiaceae bacterium]|nr:trypsin-like peptidase domain-containing protein [Streptosporangiaceae bacterium]